MTVTVGVLRASGGCVILVMAGLFRCLGQGQHAPAGRDGQDSDGRLSTGSYEATTPGRTRAQAPLTEPTDPVEDSRLASVLRRVRPGKRRPPILTVLRDARRHRLEAAPGPMGDGRP